MVVCNCDTVTLVRIFQKPLIYNHIFVALATFFIVDFNNFSICKYFLGETVQLGFPFGFSNICGHKWIEHQKIVLPIPMSIS